RFALTATMSALSWSAEPESTGASRSLSTEARRAWASAHAAASPPGTEKYDDGDGEPDGFVPEAAVQPLARVSPASATPEARMANRGLVMRPSLVAALVGAPHPAEVNGPPTVRRDKTCRSDLSRLTYSWASNRYTSG